MFYIHNSFVVPMEVVGDEGYLLVKSIEWVANYSPSDADATSTSNLCSHFGHTALMVFELF